jgi:hypothetical protein
VDKDERFTQLQVEELGDFGGLKNRPAVRGSLR